MNKTLIKKFIEEELKINVNDETLCNFETYEKLLLETNKKFNLTSIEDEESVLYKHFIDSLYAAKFVDFNEKTLCDLGTGAGFPGLVLAIMFPTLNVTLVESNGKKVSFLKSVTDELKLKNVNIINKRAEELSDLKNSFDYVTARAMTRLNILIELAIPLCKINGKLLAYKLFDVEKEILDAKHALTQLDSKIETIYKYELPNNIDKRSLLIIKKIKNTKKRFPREFSKISSNPL